MENKKRKWERDYEKYSTSKELDERLEYLQDLINGKVALKEEYEEHKKLTAIKANLPKVKNILELRGKLEEERKEIKKEIARRELIGKCEKAIKTLEDEMKKLEEEQTRLEQEIKANPEKKAELQIKLAENAKKRQANNVKFGDVHERLKEENKQKEQSKFKETSLEDLKNEATSISSHISQCNLACNKLMQGYSWKSVEASLDKYQGEKLIAKGEQASKIQQNREAAKAANAKEQQVQEEEAKESNVQPEKEQDVEEDQSVESNVQPEPEKDQDKKAIANLSAWQKARNFAKNLWGKVKQKINGDEEIEQEEAVVENRGNEPKTSFWQKVKNWLKGDEPKEQANEEPESQASNPEQPENVAEEEQPVKKEDSFRQYLRDVAAKGIDGIEQERLDAEKTEKEARRQAAIEKYNKNRAGKDTGATVTNLEKNQSTDNGR